MASSDDCWENGIIRRWHHPTIAGTMTSSNDGHDNGWIATQCNRMDAVSVTEGVVINVDKQIRVLEILFSCS